MIRNIFSWLAIIVLVAIALIMPGTSAPKPKQTTPPAQ